MIAAARSADISPGIGNVNRAVIGVRMKPGQMLVSAMPRRRAAGAEATVQASTAAFEAL
jgi:hypothetical protein